VVNGSWDGIQGKIKKSIGDLADKFKGKSNVEK
jgi:uncharacterized protein YjbJ (UPF0337 family)